ncbi:MAG: (2Fe-2S) ferredoxin domain-containing protein [Coleofasciculaceae cyanobacterium]
MVDLSASSKQVLVCQSHSCRKQGAAKVLAAFQSLPVTEVTVIASGCLGQCGNGPMVLVVPEETWYSGVQVDEVPTVVERHLRSGRPVYSMLYLKYHQTLTEKY